MPLRIHVVKEVAMQAVLTTILVVIGAIHALSEPLTIIGFDHDGNLGFQGATVSNYYTLEFATSADGPWTNWGSLCDQPVTGTVMSSPSPMFYRIRQVDSSAFPPYAPVEHTHSNISATMLAPDQVVKSINSFRDNVTISGGSNVTVTPSGNGIEISAVFPNGGVPNMQVFDTNGIFTVPAGVTRIMVEVWGGGGGGGAAYNVGGPSGVEGGGGGGGGYGKQVFTVTPGATYNVSVGSGGAGSTGSGASAGGTSSFGALVSAPGGGGGVDGSSTKHGAGGSGGTSTALINLPGEAGNQFGSNAIWESPRCGGASPCGGNGGMGGGPPGGVGTAPGGGGGGGGGQPEGFAGSNGAKGRVIVYY